MNRINFDFEILDFWGQLLCTFVVVPLAIIGTVIWLRKDRTIPSLLFTICGAIALLMRLFDRLIYVWITDGWLLISESDKLWYVHCTTQSVIDFLKSLSAVVAAIAFVVCAARLTLSNQDALESDKLQSDPVSKLWSFPLLSAVVSAVIVILAMSYYHVAYCNQEEMSHSRAIFLISCKTDNLNADTLESHFGEHYGDLLQQSRVELAQARAILKSNPGAELFHYNTPKEIWEQLGGRRGYAILYDGKIIWEYVLAIS